jgi:nucleoside-diphosphate-sugar epimerase
MTTAIVTGSAGLVGSETVRFLHEQGMDVIGIDNNLREYFFGPDGSTRWMSAELTKSLSRYRHFDLDIRDQESIFTCSGGNAALLFWCIAPHSRATTGRRASRSQTLWSMLTGL